MDPRMGVVKSRRSDVAPLSLKVAGEQPRNIKGISLMKTTPGDTSLQLVYCAINE